LLGKKLLTSLVVALTLVAALACAEDMGETAVPTTVEPAAAPTAEPAAAPIIFSDEQASAFLLVANDFPKGWEVHKEGMTVEARHVQLSPVLGQIPVVRTIDIQLETHETEAAAQTAFSAKKAEAQTTIDDRGISGDKLEDVKKYPLFVWNASSQANVAGVEKWTIIGVYGNITVKVHHAGSFGTPEKGFPVDIAKKQIDRIKGD